MTRNVPARSPSLVCSLFGILGIAAGCSAEPRATADREAAARSIDAGSYEERIVLDLVNTASLEVLDDDAALDRRAATNIVAQRQGPDRIDGTSDDDLFETIDEIDAVPWVGPAALEALLDYALSIYGEEELAVPRVEVLGYWEGSPEALAILAVANRASFEVLDDDVALDRRAAENIVSARADGDILSLTELDAVSWVGGTAFSALFRYALDSGVLAEGCTDGRVWISGGETYESPATAVLAAAEGDTVYACAGTWSETITVSTSLTLVGLEGAELTVIDAAGASTSTLSISAQNVTVSGLTLTGGDGTGSTAPTGGGVYVGSAGFTLRDSIVEGNTATWGAGIAVHKDATLDGVLVRDNLADGRYGEGGGIMVFDADLVMVDTVVEHNEAEDGKGGGLHLYFDTTSVEIVGGAIRDNTATGGWGGAIFTRGNVSLTDTVIDGNSADIAGAIYQGDEDSTVRLDGVSLIRNAAGAGNGAYALSLGSLIAVDVDWGAGEDDNTPADLVAFDGGWNVMTAAADLECVNTSRDDARCL